MGFVGKSSQGRWFCLLLTVSGQAPVHGQFETAGRKAETTCSFEVTIDERVVSRPLRCMFEAK
jgi:hypothetical protein